MADDNKIGLEAVFENDEFQRGMDDYNRSLSGAVSETDSAGSDMSSVFEGLAAVGQIALTALVTAIGAVVAELYLAVDAAMETEEVMARMEFVVGNVAERTGVAAEDVLALADSLSQVVPIDDEVIASAITMGLTFDGVTKDNIEPLISAAADLALWTGKDLPSAMKELSLSISDPDKAMRLFKDASITLTDAQKETLDGLKKTGDTAGVTQFMLERLAEKGIIGFGEAMGETSKGKMTLMLTALGNLQEALGTGLLDALKTVFDRINEFASDPIVIQTFTDIGTAVGEFAMQVIDNIPPIMDLVQGLVDWFKNNKPIIVGALAAMGVAIAAFGVVTAFAIFSAVEALAPILIAMAIVGAGVALLYKAWQENWGGIQDKVAALWKQIQPIFEQLQKWLQAQLPKALKMLSTVWNKVLLPAIKTVFEYIVNFVFPVISDLIDWMAEHLPEALQTSSDFLNKVLIPAIKDVVSWINKTLIPALKAMQDWFQIYVVGAIKNLVATISSILIPIINTLAAIWTTILLPAMTAVYNFINSTLVPLFKALANLLSAVVGVAVTILAGIWQNVLKPALQAVWSFISANVLPIFQSVASTLSGVLTSAIKGVTDLWNNVFLPALQKVWDKLKPFADFLVTTLYNAFQKVKDAINFVTGGIEDITEALQNIQLPDWMTPGSPTPLEIGLKGINEQLAKMASLSLPAVQQQMNILSSVRDVPGTSSPSSTVINNNTSTSNANYIYGGNFADRNQMGFIERSQGLLS